MLLNMMAATLHKKVRTEAIKAGNIRDRKKKQLEVGFVKGAFYRS